MNLVFSIGLPDGSMTLVGSMRRNHVLPSDVESPRGVPEVLDVAGAISICIVLSSIVLSSTILMSNAIFIAFFELTIAVINPSKDSCTNVVIPS